VGRGYTDLLSALLAVGLEASELQIWKEVDGIFTADPRKASTGRLIPLISPDEAAELTYYGSEVVHPFTMEQVVYLVVVPSLTCPTFCFLLGHPAKISNQDQKRRESVGRWDCDSSGP
jgi:aspartate kinase